MQGTFRDDATCPYLDNGKDVAVCGVIPYNQKKAIAVLLKPFWEEVITRKIDKKYYWIETDNEFVGYFTTCIDRM